MSAFGLKVSLGLNKKYHFVIFLPILSFIFKYTLLFTQTQHPSGWVVYKVQTNEQQPLFDWDKDDLSNDMFCIGY